MNLNEIEHSKLRSSVWQFESSLLKNCLYPMQKVLKSVNVRQSFFLTNSLCVLRTKMHFSSDTYIRRPCFHCRVTKKFELLCRIGGKLLFEMLINSV